MVSCSPEARHKIDWFKIKCPADGHWIRINLFILILKLNLFVCRKEEKNESLE